MDVVIGYLASGLVVLVLLDIFTGRIRRNVKLKAYDTQSILARQRIIVGVKTAIVIILIVAWLFWPVYIYGAISSLWEKEHKNEQ